LEERYILEPLQILEWNDLENLTLRFEILVKTAPLKQWEVGRELAKKDKVPLPDAKGIQIPLPLSDLTPGRTGEKISRTKQITELK